MKKETIERALHKAQADLESNKHPTTSSEKRLVLKRGRQLVKFILWSIQHQRARYFVIKDGE